MLFFLNSANATVQQCNKCNMCKQTKKHNNLEINALTQQAHIRKTCIQWRIYQSAVLTLYNYSTNLNHEAINNISLQPKNIAEYITN